MAQLVQGPFSFPGKASFPACRKVYRQGSRPDIRVPFREVSLTSTSGRFGREENQPVRLYDTSGAYTDGSVELDIRRGLPPLRREWVLERGDVEEYPGIPAANGGEPQGQPFPGLKRNPMRARAGQA